MTQRVVPHLFYSYLADGTKLSASDGDGDGLVYRGPFVYRHSAGPSTSGRARRSKVATVRHGNVALCALSRRFGVRDGDRK